MHILHLIDTPIFISNEISNRCVHFSLNYFALNDGSLIFFSTTSQEELLFVNVCVNSFAHTIVCAMNKNTKITFSHNLSQVI